MSNTRFSLEVQPRIPAALSRLEELAEDLVYTWDRNVRGLFYRLDRELWRSCGHNPKVFLRRVAQNILDDAVADNIYMEEYRRVLAAFDSYQTKKIHPQLKGVLNPGQDLVAYFSAEFGVHESLPIYSGGLGILAGDHCKAASDLGIPFVAVGLLYRQGYFTQTIDAHGNQVAHYHQTQFDDLPIRLARDEQGKELQVSIDLPDRAVTLRIWLARLGHIQLVLLDSDLPVNSDHDRFITHQLYGGDIHTRMQQEIALGIGGVRALRALNLEPNVWHINEGHAAFQIVERCREHAVGDMDFDACLEMVAAGTVFTTHTPVAAGHDIFDVGMMESYFGSYVQDLGIDIYDFISLGSSPSSQGGFNMTSLALRGSRFHNGVSRIHGSVASKMEGYIWPQIPHAENPIRYVTNGVHVPTFLAREWTNLFDMRFREWRNELLDKKFWECIDEIPDHRVWSLQQSLKAELLESVYERVLQQHRRNGVSEALLKRICQYVSEPESDVLVLGFARRFATYKRAALIFSDPERLKRLLNDPERPVLLIFAGKAHPSDMPGQNLIRVIHEYSMRPEFQGKILLLEGYDIALGRKLVTGVDVWINNPEYPMEASGTSGEKAGINGVMNLSVLDGWWGEGYNGENGWAITPHGPEFDAAYRDQEEGNDLLTTLERDIVPLYYHRDNQGYSSGWVQMSKASMKSIIPDFNAQRMVMDYVKGFYTPAKQHAERFAQDNAQPARELARWKTKVRKLWPGVRMQRIDKQVKQIKFDETLAIHISANLNGLQPEDVVLECLIGTQENNSSDFKVHEVHTLLVNEDAHGEGYLFSLDLHTNLPGLQYYKIRMYPYHRLLVHPFEVGCMLWL
jgi:starch phosphorylase